MVLIECVEAIPNGMAIRLFYMNDTVRNDYSIVLNDTKDEYPVYSIQMYNSFGDPFISTYETIHLGTRLSEFNVSEYIQEMKNLITKMEEERDEIPF